jgi:hypothetical protein
MVDVRPNDLRLEPRIPAQQRTPKNASRVGKCAKSRFASRDFQVEIFKSRFSSRDFLDDRTIASIIRVDNPTPALSFRNIEFMDLYLCSTCQTLHVFFSIKS